MKNLSFQAPLTIYNFILIVTLSHVRKYKHYSKYSVVKMIIILQLYFIAIKVYLYKRWNYKNKNIKTNCTEE